MEKNVYVNFGVHGPLSSGPTYSVHSDRDPGRGSLVPANQTTVVYG